MVTLIVKTEKRLLTTETQWLLPDDSIQFNVSSMFCHWYDTDDLMLDWGNSSVLAMDLKQPCAKQFLWWLQYCDALDHI